MSERLGDAPIQGEFVDIMNDLARALDKLLNGDRRGNDRESGFVLMVFPFEEHEGRCNYISNAKREDVVTMLKEQLARFEGQPELRGRA